jgi:hypothetical protein
MKTTPIPHPIIAALTLSTGILATETATEADPAAELAKKLANPIANLISVPLQNNFLFNVGPGNGFRETTNIQPVIPFELNEHWNLISRTILPNRSQPVSVGLMGTWYAEAPDSAPDWGVRMVFTFLFPKS